MLELKGRELRGVRLVVSDEHAGLMKGFGEVFTDALRQDLV